MSVKRILNGSAPESDKSRFQGQRGECYPAARLMGSLNNASAAGRRLRGLLPFWYEANAKAEEHHHPEDPERRRLRVVKTHALMRFAGNVESPIHQQLDADDRHQ